MKKLFLLTTMMTVALLGHSQPQQSARSGGPQAAVRKFQILVKNETDPSVVLNSNSTLRSLALKANRSADRGLFGDLLMTSYGSAFVQKTVNASSNLVSISLSYVAQAFKSERNDWYKAARQQCTYSKVLSSETTINDFYALPSTRGAMDPENLKFEGFGCKNYIELKNSPGQGRDVFYVYCKMRRDSVGLQHIVNHSKFMVELDTLLFNPRYCNLPNDSSGDGTGRFDFEKRKDLRLTLRAKIYSSWINQAVMVTNDQLLGEFTISAQIDPRHLNSDSLFIYDRNNPDFQRLVSVDGDCFIVPRSFTGTTDAQNYQPAWGTGQYRVEMEVVETCSINDAYYQIRESGNGREVAEYDGRPGRTKWDKKKWKTEWTAMKQRRRNASFWQNALQAVTTAYVGSNWLTTITDPFSTALYSYETTKLNELVDDLKEQWGATSAAGAAKAGATQARSQQQGGGQQPSGGQQPGGGQQQGGGQQPNGSRQQGGGR